MPLSEAGQEPVMWFAMSAPYRNEMKAKNFLDEKGIENFLPLQYKITTNRYGRKERKALPVVSNLLFVHTTQSIIRQAKQGVSFFFLSGTPARTLTAISMRILLRLP
jgi:hypothetical protein